MRGDSLIAKADAAWHMLEATGEDPISRIGRQSESRVQALLAVRDWIANALVDSELTVPVVVDTDGIYNEDDIFTFLLYSLSDETSHKSINWPIGAVVLVMCMLRDAEISEVAADDLSAAFIRVVAHVLRFGLLEDWLEIELIAEHALSRARGDKSAIQCVDVALRARILRSLLDRRGQVGPVSLREAHVARIAAAIQDCSASHVRGGDWQAMVAKMFSEE